MIREDLIHYIWKTKSFDQSDFKTTDGLDIHVVDFGHHNHNAGPDFLNAKVEINGTLWAGHIEIHLKASDWLRHRHDNDPAYQNVILHVVMEADSPIELQDGTNIPCVELKNRINHKLIGKYQYLQNTKSWIPCADFITKTSDIIRETTKSRAIAQRLTKKANELTNQLEGLNQDLNELIYRRLAWAFGLKVNADAMATLAQSLPYSIIAKHKDQKLQIEALLYGQSGLLPSESEDVYVQELIREYSALNAKFKLTPMAAVQWKFSKLRPPAFPTIRIAQFAAFLYAIPRLDELIFNHELKEIRQSLDIELGGYWMDHYRFGIPSTARKKTLGKGTQSIIVINAIVPILYMYGVDRQSERHREKALELLESLPPELNSITKRWSQLEMSNDNAADSQALLELKKANCDQHQCMACPIGHKIVSGDI